MSIRPDFEDMAKDLGCAPKSDPCAQFTLHEALGSYLYGVYRDIAIRERSSVVAVVRDVLRMNAEYRV